MQFVCGILIGALSVGLADPVKSDNEGKIVGKWESVAGGILPPGVEMSLSFTKDGKFSMGVAALGVMKTVTGTYTLGAGSSVILDNLSEPLSGKTKHTEKIVIADGKLTMTDADGKAVSFKAAKEKK